MKSVQTSTENKLKLLSEKIDELQKEVNSVKQQLDSYHNELQETSSSLVELNRKIERVNNDIVELLKKIELLSNEISYLKRENIEIKQQVETSVSSISTTTVTYTPVKPTSVSTGIEFDDFNIINKKIEQLKKEVEEIKEQQKLQTVSEIKDPNLRRIVTSPYLVLTTLLVSIFALIAAF